MILIYDSHTRKSVLDNFKEALPIFLVLKDNYYIHIFWTIIYIHDIQTPVPV
jgi:hypothetical protein